MVTPAGWSRRARPLLGTLVDVGVQGDAGVQDQAQQAAWVALEQVQAGMSLFESASDIARSHLALVGEPTRLHPWTAEVLRLAQALHAQTEGLFDVACGSGRWLLDEHGGHCELVRLDARTRIDLGGIAKGFAVDQAVLAALAAGAQAVWVNAGGDLRVQGASLPVVLRDERHGGVRPWLVIEDGAMATSDFSPEARARLAWPASLPEPPSPGGLHLSVAAPECVVADALTKVVAILGRIDHPMAQHLLRHYGAQAWVHADASPEREPPSPLAP
jgi:thiamine biosynthesis lipoprotein